jgi:hypothetical protein
MVSGWNMVSPSTMTTISVRAAAMAALSAAGLPALGCWISQTPGMSRRRTISPVPSVEPSSTTITSSP